MAPPIHFDENMFMCDICGKKLGSQSSLSRHRRLHMDKKYQCFVCDKKFAVKQSLKQHLISHASEADNTCPECGKRFKHRQSLDRHVKGHKGEGETTRHRKTDKETCEKCKRDFLHIKRHRQLCKEGRKRQFECMVCGRRFLEKRYLNEHCRCVHSYEERYQCPVCSDKFHYRASLLKHKRRSH